MPRYGGDMVHLTRIYTRTGDDGTTSLGDFSRTSKNDPRLLAYASVDETNTALGVAVAIGHVGAEIEGVLARIQNELFDVGADLCTPIGDKLETKESRIPRVTADYVTDLEVDCDNFNERLEPLRSFVLPGGSPGAALLHAARTNARRAERCAWLALNEYDYSMNPITAQYLNRLSDLLFILARVANRDHGDVLWQPGRAGL